MEGCDHSSAYAHAQVEALLKPVAVIHLPPADAPCSSEAGCDVHMMEGNGNAEQKSRALHLNGPSELLPLLAKFSDLSAGTEFGQYKDPEWRFLLLGEDISGFASSYVETGNDADHPGRLDGCILRVHIDECTVGYGMVLVRPSRRRRGVARQLFEKALRVESDKGKRFVLAVCSDAAQPLYRQLGFTNSGTITAVTCSVPDLLRVPPENCGNEYLAVSNGTECTNEQLDLLCELDRRGTGIDRSQRIKLLLNGHAEGSKSTVALLSTTGKLDPHSTTFAIAMQDYVGGPVFIGPMKGKEDCCVPLIRALIQKHFEGDEEKDLNSISAMMMVADHSSLVGKLLEVEGMVKSWESPAMTSDGKPVWQNGDGSYLAMMHPTLG